MFSMTSWKSIVFDQFSTHLAHIIFGIHHQINFHLEIQPFNVGSHKSYILSLGKQTILYIYLYIINILYCFAIIMLFSIPLIALCIINTSSQRVIKNLGLNEGDMCREDPGMIFRFTYARDCPTVKESIITRNHLDICGFVGLEPIVCCSTKAIEPLVEIPETKNKNSTPTKESKKIRIILALIDLVVY
ncbi:hypothetical protein AGLY_014676 [Aphis glycines]|uniref:CLIP domain-containing serine protease n=1 Tax=Aphis glycines TaxID=307491 RepID=A0A6G0T1W1_APHGL|nr:hypothetical protein AGLY_014676 [Aphis glycines]